MKVAKLADDPIEMLDLFQVDRQSDGDAPFVHERLLCQQPARRASLRFCICTIAPHPL
jgi:hypothetical protein